MPRIIFGANRKLWFRPGLFFGTQRTHYIEVLRVAGQDSLAKQALNEPNLLRKCDQHGVDRTSKHSGVQGTPGTRYAVCINYVISPINRLSALLRGPYDVAKVIRHEVIIRLFFVSSTLSLTFLLHFQSTQFSRFTNGNVNWFNFENIMHKV